MTRFSIAFGAAPVDLGKAARQMVEQQRQHLRLPEQALGQGLEHLGALAVEPHPPLGELGREGRVDLDPVAKVERLQPHREPPGAVQERSIARHDRLRIWLKITPI